MNAGNDGACPLMCCWSPLLGTIPANIAGLLSHNCGSVGGGQPWGWASAGIRTNACLCVYVRSGARAIQLTPCTRKALDKIKEAEESKEKTYWVLCWAER